MRVSAMQKILAQCEDAVGLALNLHEPKETIHQHSDMLLDVKDDHVAQLI